MGTKPSRHGHQGGFKGECDRHKPSLASQSSKHRLLRGRYDHRKQGGCLPVTQSVSKLDDIFSQNVLSDTKSNLL